MLYTYIHKSIGFAALLLLGSAFSAQAQSIDYQALEELFEEPVTTSANGSPQRLHEVPLNMEILTKEDIRHTGARTIPEALRYLPGVSVRQYSFGQTEVSIRGYNQASAERILVLLNGRQVYTDFYGQVVWDNIPVEMNEIQQIEVVKGPNTALFGFNAVSGVINIVTTNPLLSDAKELDVRTGTHGLREVSAYANQKLGETVAVRISGGGYETNDAFNDFERNSPAKVEADRRSYMVDMWAQLDAQTQAHIEVSNNTNSLNSILSTRSGLSSGVYETDSVRTQLLTDTSYGNIEADIYHNATTADYATAGTIVNFDNHITVAKLSNTFEGALGHTFRIGTEYRKASNHTDVASGALDQGDLTSETMGINALWDWRISDHLNTSAAVRYDYFRLEPDAGFISSAIRGAYAGFGGTLPFSTNDYYQEFREVSYNLGAVYYDEANKYYASVARGVDMPSFVEFGLQFFVADPDGAPANPAASAMTVLGDPTLQPSIVHNYELGYDRQIASWDSVARASIFLQTSEDMQSYAARFNDAVALDESFIGNGGDSTMYGFEVGLDGDLNESWDYFVNYAYIEVQDDINRASRTTTPLSSPTAYEDSTANHVINGHLSYKARDWRANVFAQYTTSFDELFANNTPNSSYSLNRVNDTVIMNANVAYDIGDNVTWYVSGTNVLGTNAQTAPVDAETTLWTGINWRF